MGGHGALTIGLKNPGMFKVTVIAFTKAVLIISNDPLLFIANKI